MGGIILIGQISFWGEERLKSRTSRNPVGHVVVRPRHLAMEIVETGCGTVNEFMDCLHACGGLSHQINSTYSPK